MPAAVQSLDTVHLSLASQCAVRTLFPKLLPSAPFLPFPAAWVFDLSAVFHRSEASHSSNPLGNKIPEGRVFLIYPRVSAKHLKQIIPQA